MICGNPTYNVRVLNNHFQITFFGSVELEFLGTGLREVKEKLGNEPAEALPAGWSGVKILEIGIIDGYDLGIFHCLDKIGAGILVNKAAE
jgi:hypothetical protein